MGRVVEPEWLDELPPHDGRAMKSRTDIRRLNALMGHVHLMSGLLLKTGAHHRTCRIVDLGAGDGTFALRLIRRLEGLRRSEWIRRGCVRRFLERPNLEWLDRRLWAEWLHGFEPEPESKKLVLVERQQLVSEQTRLQFEKLGWRAQIVTADVFEWLDQPCAPSGTVLLANLFLHHLQDDQLRMLLRYAAARGEVFAACEPRRSGFALTASRLVGLVGCNEVSRHDAVVSVRAGFSGGELSSLWPQQIGWSLLEREAGLFSHCFLARRHETMQGAES
jgi:hypothetical protein